jgi:hypothetical protein
VNEITSALQQTLGIIVLIGGVGWALWLVFVLARIVYLMVRGMMDGEL